MNRSHTVHESELIKSEMELIKKLGPVLLFLFSL